VIDCALGEALLKKIQKILRIERGRVKNGLLDHQAFSRGHPNTA